jgi:hypothetical protein
MILHALAIVCIHVHRINAASFLTHYKHMKVLLMIISITIVVTHLNVTLN